MLHYKWDMLFSVTEAHNLHYSYLEILLELKMLQRKEICLICYWKILFNNKHLLKPELKEIIFTYS